MRALPAIASDTPLLMIKAFKIIWVVLVVGFCTAFGALLGWQKHGLVGAIALGFVGFCAGGIIASSPQILS